MGQPLDDVRATLLNKLPEFSGRHSVQVHIDEDAEAEGADHMAKIEAAVKYFTMRNDPP
ncbi:hypothetical protein [Herbaspirillum sp. GCM10030257]|uniref:hypothetical protein n=1 Tax=Herbaspirillum sp. GCM10030257 TaxID=3273393 RepID=UPI0036D373C0